MSHTEYQNLEKDLSILGKNAHLSLAQKQAIRDKVFKRIGQLDLIDSLQTKTESLDLVMPVKRLQDIFRPRKVMLSLPATLGLIATVFLATFTTGALANDAQPGDPLFGVKKVFETVQVALTRDLAQKAAVQLSIADERLKGLENIDPAKLEAALSESQKALTSAQNSVSALKGASPASSEELLNKLQELVNNQKNIIGTIVKNNVGNSALQETVVAVRDELDKLLPEAIRKPIAEPAEDETASAIDSFYGFLVPAYGQVALNSNGKILILPNVSTDILSKYIALDKINVIGHFTPQGIVVQKILLDGKLIFENQGYISNNLPRVEDSQN